MISVRKAKSQRVAVVAGMLLGSVFGLVSVASGSSTPTLYSASPQGFKGALGTSSRLLYLLTSEKGGSIKCSGSCLKDWPPLLIKKSGTKVTLGKGVRGTIGFVARGKGEEQVTFNSFPVYTFAGDTGSSQHHGEGLTSDGGTWYLVKASATSPGVTSLKPMRSLTTSMTHPTTSSTTTTTRPPTTTTTRPPATTTTRPPTTTTTRPPTTTTTQPSAPPIAY